MILGIGIDIIEVERIQSSFEKFGETLMPILGEFGIGAEGPDIMPVHNIVQ